VAWLIPLACATIGMGALMYLVRRVQAEIDPTRVSLGRIGTELRPALVRVTDETARARRRLDG
jgi:hypothetical protein